MVLEVRTLGVRTLDGVGESRRSEPAPRGGRESANSLAPDRSCCGPDSTGRVERGAGPSPIELAAAAAVTTAVLGDPMALALALQCSLRDQGAANSQDSIRSSQKTREAADAERIKALADAAKALKKAKKKAPPWVKKLIGAVLTAVGTVASIAAGTGVALVAAGAAILLAAQIAEKVLMKLAEKGVISQKGAIITAAIVKVVAAVAAACTGQVGGLGAAAGGAAQAGAAVVEVAKSAADILKTVANVINAAAEIAFAGVDTHISVRKYQAEMANILAEEWGMNSESAIEDGERAAELFAGVYKDFSRSTAIVNAAMTSQNEMQLAAARAVA